jgi:hypothetical protein
VVTLDQCRTGERKELAAWSIIIRRSEIFGRVQPFRIHQRIEAFGWLLLTEGITIFIAPHGVGALLDLPPFSAAAAVYFRLVGLLIAGLGALYTVSGRVNAQGFVFASFFDRPFVPFIMAVLWWNELIPAILAIAFSVQDFASFSGPPGLGAPSANTRDRRRSAFGLRVCPAGPERISDGLVRRPRSGVVAPRHLFQICLAIAASMNSYIEVERISLLSRCRSSAATNRPSRNAGYDAAV